jgi:death-on-curing protein
VADTVFLSYRWVIAVHERVVGEFGGDRGIRDAGLLDSAVAMPRQQFGGEYLHADLASQAAAYLFHICRNHAFIDGNKRSALASAELFVMLNGRALEATNEELVDFTLGVADGSICKEAAIEFFKRHTTCGGNPG